MALTKSPSQPGSQANENNAERFLEAALFWAFVIHFVATVTMGTLLLPALPGAINADAERVAYIAKYPIVWNLGWLPWHLCALSDLVLAVAMVRTKWIPKLPAIITLILTVAAVAVEQPAEFLWNFEGARVAQVCMASGSIEAYLDLENEVFPLVGSIAAIIYAFMAMGWSWCFAAAGTWNRFLTWFSALTWSLLLCTASAPLLPDSVRPSLLVIGIGNAVGFNLMAIWFIAVMEAVLRRSRRDEDYGRMALWKYPRVDSIGSLFTVIGNSRFLRYAGEWIPSVAMISDIEDVIYVNYLVDANAVEAMVPVGLELQRLGPEKNFALFSALTYRHGHFGPRFFGPLRKLMPSPVQSNWRIHVRDYNGVEGIFFVATIVTSAAVSLCGRLLCDGVPMHVAETGSVTADGDETFRVVLNPGSGSAPDMMASLKSASTPHLTGAWQECFTDFDGFLRYCVPQDRAMSTQGWYQQITRQEINLGIPLADCQPLDGEVNSNFITKLFGADVKPICFRVPTVKFAFEKALRYR